MGVDIVSINPAIPALDHFRFPRRLWRIVKPLHLSRRRGMTWKFDSEHGNRVLSEEDVRILAFSLANSTLTISDFETISAFIEFLDSSHGIKISE